MLFEILSMFRNQETLPFIILAIIGVGLIVIFERFFTLQLIYKINFEKFNQSIRRMLLASDTTRARTLCSTTSKTGVPMIILKAIQTFENEPHKVRGTVSEESLRFFPRIRRRLTQIPGLAAACVLVGAIASINGVWETFQLAEGIELGVKNFVFSRGISTALIPLGFSLVGALILMIPYGILDAVAWRLEGEMEHSVCMILNMLSPDIPPMMASASHVMVDNSPRSANEDSFDTSTDSLNMDSGTKENANGRTATKAGPAEEEEEII